MTLALDVEARGAALDILRGVRSGLTFDAALERATLPSASADRRLAHEIAAGVLRHRTRLDAHLAPLARQGWAATPDDIKDVLRIGAYQLAVLDRVPAHAAVQASVETAKRAIGAGPAKLVNAVLRRIADGRAPPPALETLAERYSHPVWLVDRWVARWGDAKAEALLAHDNTRPPLVIQPVRPTDVELAEALAKAGVPHRPAAFGLGFQVESVKVTDLPGFPDGAFVVQDPAQRMLLESARIAPGSLVWDACASPGGKAALLARRGRVIASDVGQSRIPRLLDTLRRAAPEVPALVADACRPPFVPGAVGVVLVDAPCSATGTIARHPDARWRLRPERIDELAGMQADLLSGAASAVTAGGRVVYMTCSLEPEENHQVVDRFLATHLDFRRVQPDTFVFPPDAGTDGGFAAVLERA